MLIPIIILVSIVMYLKFGRSIKKALFKPNFQGKNVWITGASSGLGEQLSQQFANAGANVILSSRKKEDLEKVRLSLKNPDNHTVLPLDMSKMSDITQITEKLVSDFEKQGKKLDIVIENAGVSQRAKCINTDYETHEYITNINYNGPVAHTKGYLSHMIKNSSGQIVIMSSVAGKLTPGMRTSYVGSKHAVSGFYDSLRAEVTDHNIAITQIYPGYVQTNISKNAMTGESTKSLGKTDSNIAGGMQIEDFGKEAMFIIGTKQIDRIVSTESKHYLGTYIKQLLPEVVANRMYKNMKNQEDALKKAK